MKEIVAIGKRPRPSTMPFNLLQTGELDMQLLVELPAGKNSRLACVGHDFPEIVLSRQVLHQTLPDSLDHLIALERLNMIHQIPELGVVVVGNQAGRVGIFTMTYWKVRKQYGFKIEAILPYESQEREGLRPTELLMGMAVGPVQGYHLPNPNGTGDQDAGPRLRAG